MRIKELGHFMKIKHDKKLIMSFSFKADPRVSKWMNLKNILASMKTTTYFARNNNNTYHNLCLHLKPPDNIGSLLGLGLKFCIQNRRPDKNAMDEAIQRLTKDMRLKYLFQGEDDNETNNYNRKLYIKSQWEPPPASRDIENRITKFSEAITEKRTFITSITKQATNLTTSQQHLLKQIRDDPRFIILMTDKNLGPAIMEKEVYIERLLDEHLCDGKTYKQITPEEARTSFRDFYEDLQEILETHERCLEDNERVYFMRGMQTADRIPQFYGTPKVHKKMKPHLRFRPVNSNCGSLSAVVSKYVDFYLQKLIPYVPSHVRNSVDVREQLQKLEPTLNSTSNIYLCTSDAVSMYTNIDPEEGIPIIEKYLGKYAHECKSYIPSALIIKLLKLVMTTNVFQFGNTWWKQLIGTAMGTPCACVYATLFFAYYERTYIIPKYKQNILLYKRFIDDIFLVWKNNPNDPSAFKSFKQDLNDQCKLNWETEKLTKSVNFLDLTITWKKNKFITRTYQKAMNLFLYIPEHSAHPPGLTKSLITGLLETYYRQNSQKEDFIYTSNLLYKRLLARGHKAKNIKLIFDSAASNIHNKLHGIEKHTIKTSTKFNERLFFHIPFHPKDVSRQQIRDMYENTCENPHIKGESFKSSTTIRGDKLRVNQLTIAYSRANNLRDRLCSSKLKESKDHNVQDILHKRDKGLG